MSKFTRSAWHNLARSSVPYWLTGCTAALIGVATLIPITETSASGGMDKIVHVIAFSGLVLPLSFSRPPTLRWLVPFTIAYGGAIELVQPYAGRGREGLDFIADVIGIGMGVAIGLGVRQIFELKSKQVDNSGDRS